MELRGNECCIVWKLPFAPFKCRAEKRNANAAQMEQKIFGPYYVYVKKFAQ